jgi:hypothetical protein
MPDLSNYMKQSVADFFFRPGVAAPARPTSLKMSLWSAVTDADAGTGTELVGNGYLRSLCTFGTVSLPSGLLSTNFVCVFPTATANWVQATHYGIHDHLGNLLQSLVALTTPTTVLAGNHAEASAGALTITLS